MPRGRRGAAGTGNGGGNWNGNNGGGGGRRGRGGGRGRGRGNAGLANAVAPNAIVGGRINVTIQAIYNPIPGNTRVRVDLAELRTATPPLSAAMITNLQHDLRDSGIIHSSVHNKVDALMFRQIRSNKYKSPAVAPAAKKLRRSDDDSTGASTSSAARENDGDEQAKQADAKNIENGKRTFSEMEEKDRCAVCLADYEEGDEMKRLECGHDYHTNCLKTWFQTKATCPICRQCALCHGPDSFHIEFTGIDG